ncbi:MAG: ATP-binding cassette domain-containing protein [Beijerinckiaceae bacterium]
MLHIADCVLTYPDFRAHYSLDVARGALCAVVGPSGGGKTTLLNAIAGFETPDSGVMQCDGADLLPLRPGQRPLAMVFQEHNLFPHLSAFENVALGIRPSLHLSDAEIQRVRAALDAVELESFETRLPGALSGGQRSRVALARALASHKPLLLLDEPFGALDPGLRRSMIRLVDDLRRKNTLTALMTIHTPDDILDVADQCAFIADGAVIAAGAPRSVLMRGRDPRIDAFVG